MPIKKENFELYPPNWRKISWWIIHIRAHDRCEGILEDGTRCMAVNHLLHPVTGKMVVLSVAHLDHNPQNSDQDLPPDAPLEKSNMRAFCQRCHNRWDREHRNESIKQTYKEKHGETGFDMSGVNKELEKLPLTVDDAKKEADIFFEAAKAEKPQDSLDQMILTKSIELQTEYLKLLSMSNEEIATPQVQAKLTVLRSKMGVIDQLKSLRKTIKEATAVKDAAAKLGSDVQEVEAEEIPDEDIQIKGHGIRTIINSRKK